VFFNHFAAGEPSANVCVAHGTARNDPSVYIATTAQNRGCEFRPRQFRSVSGEALAATRPEARLKNIDLGCSFVFKSAGPASQQVPVKWT